MALRQEIRKWETSFTKRYTAEVIETNVRKESPNIDELSDNDEEPTQEDVIEVEIGKWYAVHWKPNNYWFLLAEF